MYLWEALTYVPQGDLKGNRDANEVKANFCYLANVFVNPYEPTKNILRKCRVLNKLGNNKDILKTTPDKGNRVVIVDRWLYMSGMYDVVYDVSKFLKLPSDPTLRREGKLQRFLRTLKYKDFFTKEQCNIYPCGSQPARIYSTPKTCKLKSPTDTLTLCPIVSSIDTYNYNLAKFLTDMLDPVIPTEYCAKDSFILQRDTRAKLF